MPKNPVWEIYSEKTSSGLFTPSVSSNSGKFEKANEAIEKYLEKNHDKAAVDNINSFIKDYNKNVKDSEYKITYDVVIDNKGNIFTHKNLDSDNSFVKVYAPNSEIVSDTSKSVSTSVENEIRKIAAEDNKIKSSEKDFIELVEKLRKSGKAIHKVDIEEAYDIIAKDKKITPSERKMFDALLDVNKDMGVSTVAKYGKTLIYEKDEAGVNYIDDVPGKVKAKGDLHETYGGTGKKVLTSNEAPDGPEESVASNKPKRGR